MFDNDLTTRIIWGSIPVMWVLGVWKLIDIILWLVKHIDIEFVWG
jgi:hypothetical protein